MNPVLSLKRCVCERVSVRTHGLTCSLLVFWANFSSIFRCVCACLCVCVFKHCMYAYVCVYTRLRVCVYVCVTWGHNSAPDSFIKCGAASEAAVNQFYLLCVGGQLSRHPQTPTPQEWTGWLLLLQLCCCRLVVKVNLFSYEYGSPEERERLPLHSGNI